MNINQLSQEQQDRLQEYFRCKNDPVYFCENYLKLPLAGGDVNVSLYEPQKDYLRRIYSEHHLIALKSRQVGISAITQMYCAHAMTFYKNVIIGVVSKSGAESTDFCRKTMSLIRTLPDWLRPSFVKETEQTFILDNGCHFYSGQVNEANPESLFRGKSITILIVDEAAFIPKIDEAFTSCAPALFKAQTRAKELNIPFATLIISTPNRTTGRGKWYYNNWCNAANNESIYRQVKIHWTMIKEFKDDPNWYKTQCSLLGNIKWKIDQELDMQFIASNNSFLPSETIEVLNKAPNKIINRVRLKNNMEIVQFKQREDKFYLIGIDTASSSGLDSSTIEVFDYETFEQVAEFKGKLRVEDFCDIIDTMTKIYPNNLIIPESNSYGNQVVEYLTRKGVFYNIYQTKVGKDKSKTTKFRYGIYTGPQNRPLIMDALYTYMSEDPQNVKSEKLALELIGLVDNGGKVMAEEGERDDLAMATAFCCYVKLYDPPMAISKVYSSGEALDEFEEIMDWNNESTSRTPKSSRHLIEIRDSEVGKDLLDTQEKMNSSLNKFVKKNLPNLLSEPGSTIDLTKYIFPKQ